MSASPRAAEHGRREGPHPEPHHLGLLVFVALAWVAHADVTWFDAGELTAAQAGLGVPHPTGFPLLVLIGYVASLLPLGPLPLRVALVSAGSVAIATALVHATALRLLGDRPDRGPRAWMVAVGALCFPATWVVWLHGSVVEVYSLNALLIAGLAWLLLRPQPRWEQAAFVTGLGLGAHATFPLTAAIFWVASLTVHGAWRRVARWVPWGLLGALIIAYLPVAAGREPWLNWGDPSSVQGLVRHLTAAGIRESFADEMGVAGASSLEALQTWSRLALGPVPVVALLVVGVGGAALVRPRWAWFTVLVALGADAWFSAVLNPMGQADLQTGMPGALAASLLLALTLGSAASAGRPRGVRLGAAAVGGAVLLLAGAESLEDRPGDELAGPYGRAALLEPSPGSLVLVSSDHLAGQFLYHQGVEGVRPDLTVVVKQHAHHTPAVVERYERRGLTAPAGYLALPPERQAARVEALVRGELGRRGVYWEPGDGRFDPIVAGVLRPVRVLYRVATSRADAERPTGSLASPTAELVAKLPGGREPASRSRRVLSDLAGFRGVWHLLRGENAPGGACLEEAAALDADNPRALLNLAAARRRQGRLTDGIALLERATTLMPRYRKAWGNLALYREEAGDPAGAAIARQRLDAL